jgi:hypothetical protein
MSQDMGRSFDRGGKSRQERERGKRRSYRQAERDREAREAVTQAKRTAMLTTMALNRQAAAAAAASAGGAVAPAADTPPASQVTQGPAAPAHAAAPRPGLLARMFGGIFKKSA